MKKVTGRFLIGLLTSIILLTGNGIVLSIHTCFAKSDRKVSLFVENSCCDTEKKSCDSENDCNKLTSKCCSSEHSYYKISAPFLIQKFSYFFTAPAINSLIYLENFSTKIAHVSDDFITPFPPEDIPFLYHQLLI